MDKRLQRYLSLVYYRVLGEAGIAGCSRRSEIYLGGVGRGGVDVHACLFIDHAVQSYFSHVKFSQLVSTVKLFLIIIE